MRPSFLPFGVMVTCSLLFSASPSPAFNDEELLQHLKVLSRKMPEGFHMVVQPPFVVIGDEPVETVKLRAQKTVKWAVDKLKAAYFDKDPERIIDIWLFADDGSYEKNTHEIFGERPHTPYGYYSESHNALIMNIGTGGGTLVHEIVHPFVKANFPGCPPWFNEGLGSLYEQSGEENGSIHGYTNWRLAGLKKAIRAGSLISFEKLTGADESEFYNNDRGDNYAQARYLCYYLQQKGLLFDFYKEFFKNRASDPSGYKTLQRILDEKDMEAFQKNWEAWVLKLTFP